MSVASKTLHLQGSVNWETALAKQHGHHLLYKINHVQPVHEGDVCICFPENCNMLQSTKFLQVHWKECWVRNTWSFSVPDTMIFRVFASVHTLGTKKDMETIKKPHPFGLVWNRVFETECIGGSCLVRMERGLLLEEQEHKHRHSSERMIHFLTGILSSWLP